MTTASSSFVSKNSQPQNRVCFLLNNEFVFDNRVRREAESLAAAGYQVSVLCVQDTGLPNRETRLYSVPPSTAGASVEVSGQVGSTVAWAVHRIFRRRLNKNHALGSRLWRTFAAIVGHYKGLFKRPFDVVHAHDANTLMLGWLLSRLWRVPLIYDSHEYWAALFLEQHETLDEKFKQGLLARKDYQQQKKRLTETDQLEQWILARCDGVITVGPCIADFLQQRMKVFAKPGQSDSPCVVVANAWQYMPEPTNEQTLDLKRFHSEYQLPGTTRVVLYQGQIAEKRGLGVLIDAFEHLGVASPQADELALVLMGPILPGDAAYVDQIRARVKRSEWLSKRVFFKPSVSPEGLLDWTRCADLGVHPILNTGANHYYCLPNKLFEYVQAGLPVGLSGFPEMKRLVEEHKLGFTFDPEVPVASPEALAQQLIQFFLKPEEAEKTRNAVREAKKVLCWEAQVPTLLGLYQQVLHKTPIGQATFSLK